MWNYDDLDEKSKPTWSAAALTKCRRTASYDSAGAWWRPLMQEFMDKNSETLQFDAALYGENRTLAELVESCFGEGMSMVIVLPNGFDCILCVPPCGHGLLPQDVALSIRDRLNTFHVVLVKLTDASCAVVERQTKFFAHLDQWVKKCCIDSANYELRRVLKDICKDR